MSDMSQGKAITKKLLKFCLTKQETVLMIKNYNCMFLFRIICSSLDGNILCSGLDYNT